MDPSMGGAGNSHDFDFPVDPSLLDESSWGLPPQNGPYSHQDQFTPQPNYHPHYSAAAQYGSYGVPQPSPYTSQSPYGNQFQPQSHTGAIGMAQYDMNYLSGPSNQQAAAFSYPILSNAGASTISPQVLQRNDINTPQSHQRNTLLNGSQIDMNNPLTHPGIQQQGWSHDTTGNFGSNPLTNHTGPYTQQSDISQGIVNYPSIVAASTAVSGSSRAAPITSAQASQIPPTQTATQKNQVSLSQNPPNSLKITHQDLLSSVRGKPFRIPDDAPYIVIDEEPVYLELKGAKLLSTKPLKTKSAKALSGASTTGAVPKTHTAKSTTSPSKVKSSRPPQIKDIKPRPSAVVGIKAVESPSPSLVSSSEEESSSDEEDEDDDEMEDELKNLREETRPMDPVAAAGWDATGIVWVPRYREAYREEIIKATPEFEKLIVGLRDELKSVNADLAKADTEKRLADSKKLKELRVVKRKILQSAVSKALENGHHDILRQLGNSQKLVNGLVSILIDCIKMEDYDGDLPRAVLRLLAKFTTLNDGLLEKVKFAAVEKRFNKNGDTELKGYVATIRANTTEAKEKAKKIKEEAEAAEKQKPLTASQDIAKPVKTEYSSKVTSLSSLKRSHEADSNNGKPNKKVASDTTAVISAQKTLATKPRTNFFANLKRPGLKPSAKLVTPTTTATATTTPPAAGFVRKTEPKTEPAPQPSSNLAAILASIEKPREVPKPVEVPAGPPETPEEKARRERKESRRHLRVSWKNGDDLVQIKLFKHDLAEDEGRQDNMLRDAHDDRSEGMMLKQRLQAGVADEDDEPDDINDRPYSELLPIDFSTMDRRDNAFVTRGGNVKFNTPQQKIQEKREAIELMVVYTDLKDIPPSPKEPGNATSDVSRMEQAFGYPSQPWLVERLQEINQYGWSAAMSFAGARLAGKTRPPVSQPKPDITSILNGLKAQPQQPASNAYGYQQSSAPPPTTSQAIGTTTFNTTQAQRQQAANISNNMNPTEFASLVSGLEKIIAPLKGKPFPAVEPPSWMTDKGKAMWWEGYNRDRASKESSERMKAGDAAALVQATQTQTHHPPISSYTPPPPKTSENPIPAYGNNQLQNILAGLPPQTQNQNSQTDAQIQSFLASLNTPNQTAHAQPLGQAQPQPQGQQDWYAYALAMANSNNGLNQNYSQFFTPNQDQNQGYDSQNHGSQPRWDNNNNSSNSINNAKRQTKEQDHHRGGWDDATGPQGTGGGSQQLDPRFPGEKRKGKKPCRFWSDGKCVKGDNCGYLHEL